MIIIVLWFPLLSFLVSGSLGRIIGVTGSNILSIIYLLISVLSLIILLIDYIGGSGNTVVNLLSYLNSGIMSNNWVVISDSLVLSILIPVLLISFTVNLYSVSYINIDPHQQRFISYLGLFTCSIVLLVTSNSLIQLFIGWEAIGVSSYLLIGFWYTRISASQSALKAFIVNRIGDVALSIGVYIVFISLNTTNFDSILSLVPESNIWTLITVCLLLAAIAKSVQIGFNTWLPVSIEGPTPVSALIHAATLVTAGAFILIRLSPLFEESSTALLLTGLIGSITALFAGTVGIVQNDLKRVIAFSTCSQIGYLFLAIGVGQFNTALFHLINHAIFKALLFLSAGVIIHSVGENQDLRRIGGILFYLPVAYISFIAGSLSLMALPYLTGFYSKELILELASIQYTVQGTYLYILGTFAAGITGFYSLRLINLTFYSTPNSRSYTYSCIHNPDVNLILPLLILFIFSVILGYLAKDCYTGLGSALLVDNLSLNNSIVEAEFAISSITKIIPLVVTIIGSVLGLFYSTTFLQNYIQIYTFLSIKWALDNVVNYIGYLSFEFGLYSSKILDRGLFEYVGPYGLSLLFFNLSLPMTLSSIVSRYALVIVLSIIFILLSVINLFYYPLLILALILSISI